MVLADQRGQVTLLVIGVSLACMAVAGLTIDGTRLMLERRNIQNQVDAAALAGATVIDQDLLYTSDGSSLELDPRAAETKAAEVLAQLGARGDASIGADGSMIAVQITRLVPTTFLGLVGIRNLRVTVDSKARPVPGSL